MFAAKCVVLETSQAGGLVRHTSDVLPSELSDSTGGCHE